MYVVYTCVGFDYFNSFIVAQPSEYRPDFFSVLPIDNFTQLYHDGTYTKKRALRGLLRLEVKIWKRNFTVILFVVKSLGENGESQLLDRIRDCALVNPFPCIGG